MESFALGRSLRVSVSFVVYKQHNLRFMHGMHNFAIAIGRDND